MRFILTTLLVLGGLNQILGRSVWQPFYDLNDDLFRMPSHRFHDDFNDFMIAESSEEEPKVIDSDYEDKEIVNIFRSLLDINVDDVHSPKSREIANSKEKVSESEENVNHLFFADDDDKSEEVKPTEVADLTKSSEEELTEKDIVEFLIVLNAIDEILKNTIEDLNKPIDDDEYTSKEKELKVFEDFLKSIVDSIEEEDNKDNEDNVHTTTKKDSSEEDDTTTAKTDSSEEEFLTTQEPDSSEEDNVTTPETNSSEEEDVTTPETNSSEEEVTTPETNSSEEEDFTTHKPDSSEEDVFSTPKPDSNEDENNDEYESFVLHMIDSNEQSEKLDDHKYEIIDTIKPKTRSPNMVEFTPFSSSHNDDENIIKQYVEIREVLDNEENKLEINKINLDKDFYNIISSNNNDEGGIKKFENDVYVLQENVDRIKRHINGMENLNSKIYFQKLIKAAMKDVKAKSTNLMANI